MPALPHPQHERFAQGKVQGLTSTAAYRAAGYASTKSDGSWLASRPHIIARIAELRAEADEARRFDRMYLVRKLVAIIEAPPSAAAEDSPLCEIKVVGTKTHRVLPSKLEAIELLGKIMGWGGPAKAEPAGAGPDRFVQLLEFIRKRK